MTKAEAEEIISKFYPNYLTIDNYDKKHLETIEYANLVAECKKAEDNSIWQIVIKDFMLRLPDFIIVDWTHLFRKEPSFRLSILYPPLENYPERQRSLMLNVSILTNHYACYFSETDLNSLTHEYSFPLIGFRSQFEDKYLFLERKEKALMFLVDQGEVNLTENFLYHNDYQDKMIFDAIQEILNKNFPSYSVFPQDLTVDVWDNFTDGYLYGGQNTFNYLFSNHIF